MSEMGPIIVKRGFLTALVTGVSGTIITALICVTGLGIYALNILDRKTDGVVSFSKELLGNLPEISRSLPPVFADACSDRRDLAYRSSIEVKSRLVSDAKGERGRVVVDVVNSGGQAVTMLPLRVVVLDDKEAPRFETIVYAATPLAVGNDWCGPLLPGDKKRPISVWVPSLRPNDTVAVEVTDVRVWNSTPASKTEHKSASESAADSNPASVARAAEQDSGS